MLSFTSPMGDEIVADDYGKLRSRDEVRDYGVVLSYNS